MLNSCLWCVYVCVFVDVRVSVRASHHIARFCSLLLISCHVMVGTPSSLPRPSPPPTPASTDMSQLRLRNSSQRWSATSALTAKKKKITMDEFEKIKHQTISTGRLQISKMKELVSAKAVSFRHARALVFSFGATFFFYYSSVGKCLMMNLCPSVAPIIISWLEACTFFKLLALCCCHFSFFF